MRETLHDYCVRTGDDTLLRQWDEARNGSMTPCSISYGVRKKYGGVVIGGTSGRLMLPRVPAAVQGAHIVQVKKRFQEKTIWLPVIRSWPLNGIQPEMVH